MSGGVSRGGPVRFVTFVWGLSGGLRSAWRGAHSVPPPSAGPVPVRRPSTGSSPARLSVVAARRCRRSALPTPVWGGGRLRSCLLCFCLAPAFSASLTRPPHKSLFLLAIVVHSNRTWAAYSAFSTPCVPIVVHQSPCSRVPRSESVHNVQLRGSRSCGNQNFDSWWPLSSDRKHGLRQKRERARASLPARDKLRRTYKVKAVCWR